MTARHGVFRHGDVVAAILYALVPVLTVGIEDDFMTEVIGYVPQGIEWTFERSGFTVGDLSGLLLIPLVVPYGLRRCNRGLLSALLVLFLAVIASGLYGILRGPMLDRSLFEPSQWKTLIPMGALALAFSALFEDEKARRRFLSWFCLNQVVVASLALGRYLLLGSGQPTYFQSSVPIFAGDMLVFIVVAFAVSAFRLIDRPRVFDALCAAILGMTLLFSLRRTFMAPIVSVLLFWAGVNAFRPGVDLKTVWSGLRIGLVVGAMVWLFAGFVGPMMMSSDLIFGRMASLNVAWALDQVDPIYGTMGHVDDFLDGLETVIENPLLGQGLNVWFPLARTRAWQEANVHAGLFKIWIKLGVLGVAGYLLLFGRGLLVASDLNRRDALHADRLFVVWFAGHFLLLSIFMNSILFGYKNGFVVALFSAMTTSLLRERRLRIAEDHGIPLAASGGT